MNIQIFDTNKLTMSSLEIAELTGKEHRNVMADIRKMFEELGQAAADFSATAFYKVNNATREREVFNLPKRESKECDFGSPFRGNQTSGRGGDRQRKQTCCNLSSPTGGVPRQSWSSRF